MSEKKISFLGSVLIAGFIVGVFDAIAASVYSYVLFGSSPDKVFRYVATGVFGAEAFAGGLMTAAWGLFFHFTIAIGWTFLFYLLYSKINFFSSSKFIAGISYGFFVWLMMTFLVVPISNVPPAPFHFSMRTLVMILIHLFIIGVPISYLANRFYSSK